MEIEYSEHLEKRLTLRHIDHNLPRRLVEGAQENYLDVISGHSIAIQTIELYGKSREVMVAYRQEKTDSSC